MTYEPATTRNDFSLFPLGRVKRRLIFFYRLRCWWRGKHREVELEKAYVAATNFVMPDGSVVHKQFFKRNKVRCLDCGYEAL